MIHYIYCYTNKINQHKYVGQTNNLERRRKQHIQDSLHCHKGHENSYKSPFHAAIRKYGINNFDFEILKTIDTEDWSIVNQLETEYIQKNKSLSPNGYNLTAQGEARKGLNKTFLTDKEVNEII